MAKRRHWTSAKTKRAYQKRQSEHKKTDAQNKAKDQAPSEIKRIYHDDTPIDWQKYSFYLQSKEWASLRKKVLARAQHRCQLCNSKEKLHVHHRTYERIFKEHVSDLTVLCEPCHTMFHKYRVLFKT